jgi:hypothetical protein
VKRSFSVSNLLNSLKTARPVWLTLAVVTLVSIGSYLLASRLTFRIGFPLDDAWIHQTYARNLAVNGQWAFSPGKPSGGSTAPLWSALLAVGFLCKLSPYIWTFCLGGLALWGLSMLGEYAIRKLVPTYRPRFPWMGALIALEWHLVWAAASGMETILYALLTTAVLVLILADSQDYFKIGLLVGLCLWTRPDGITLLGPAGLVIMLCQTGWKRRLRMLANLGLGFGSLFALYLLFNLIVSGRPWPNTLYAKQAEYAVYLNMPFLQRLAQEALQPLIGVGVLLLPGVLMAGGSAIRRRQWGVPAALIWLAGFLTLYAWRLPVTYQHGRYVIPVMPVFFVLGLVGLAGFKPAIGRRWEWIIPAFWKLATGMLLVVFWGRGAYAYAQDVAFIESEMVTTAKWVSAHIPVEARIAAHDIGALGYFDNHELLDLAGLVTPEVIPFLRDEAQIALYLNQQKVSYLVIFPDWYPSLTAQRSPLYITGATYAPAAGGTNMAVYRWPGP